MDGTFVEQTTKAEAEKQLIAEEKACRLAPGVKGYLGDVQSFLKANPAASVSLEATMAGFALKDSRETNSGSHVKAALSALRKVMASSKPFAQFTAQAEVRWVRHRAKAATTAHSELKAYKIMLVRLMAESTTRKTVWGEN